MRAVVAVVALVLMPSALAVTVGNAADVTIEGGGNALALCQFALLVNTVIVAEVEDSLALVAPPPSTLPAPPALAKAACDMSARNVTISVRSPAPDLAGLVIGAPPAAGNAARASVHGPENAGAVCQGLVLVNSAIVGGGALGMEPGRVRAPVPFTNANERARCALTLAAFDVRVVREAP